MAGIGEVHLSNVDGVRIPWPPVFVGIGGILTVFYLEITSWLTSCVKMCARSGLSLLIGAAYRIGFAAK